MSQYRFSSSVAFALIASAAAFSLFHGRNILADVLLRETNLFAHLRIGQWIWEQSVHFQNPRTDIFSWSLEGKPWMPNGWLGQATVFRKVSFLQSLGFRFEESINVFQAIVVVVSVALFTLLCEQFFVGVLASVVGFFIFCLLSKNAWDFVPDHLWSLALFPGVLVLILRVTKKNLIWHILVAILWANLSFHFVLFPFLLMVVVFGRYCDGEKEKAALSLRNLCAVLLASGFNPHGYTLLLVPWNLLTQGNGQVLEWQSPNFHSSPEIPFAIAVVSICVCFMKRPLSYLWTFLWISSVGLVLLTPQGQTFFACVAALLVVQCIEDRRSLFRAAMPILSKRMVHLRTATVGAAACFLLAQIYFLHQDTLVLPFAELIEAVDRVELEFRKSGRELRLFNAISLSGVLLSHDKKVFIDHRKEFYDQSHPGVSVTKSVLDDYHELIELKPRFAKVLEHWKFNVAVLREDSSLVSVLTEREHWNVAWTSEKIVREINGRPVSLGVTVLYLGLGK